MIPALFLFLSVYEPLPAPIPVRHPDLQRFWFAENAIRYGLDKDLSRIRIYVNWLENNQWRMVGQMNAYRAELEYAKFVSACWHQLDGALRFEVNIVHNEGYRETQIKDHMKTLKFLLGEEAYAAGILPTYPSGCWEVLP